MALTPGIVLIPLAICMAALLVTGLLIVAWLRGMAEKRLEIERELVAAAGDLPGIDVVGAEADIARQARRMRWKLCAVLIGFPYVSVAISSTAGPAPRWLAPATLVCLAFWLWSARRFRSLPRNAISVRDRMRGPVRWALSLAILAAIWWLTPLAWVDRLIPFFVFAVMIKSGVVLFLLTPVWKFEHRWALRQISHVCQAWNAGDYELARRRIERLYFGISVCKRFELEGINHGFANRPVEAELCFRHALATSHAVRRTRRATMLACLAEQLDEQGRHDEALRCLQGAIEMGDNNSGSSRHCMAESLLKQGAQPQKALELVEAAMRATKEPHAQVLKPSQMATRAWALALLGRRDEAEEALSQALSEGGPNIFAAAVADRRTKKGRALLVLGQPEKAKECFRAAYDADPAGRLGARALELLTTLPESYFHLGNGFPGAFRQS